MGVQEKCAPPHCIASQVPMVYPAYITHCSCLFVTSEHSPVPAQADDLQPVHLLRMFAQSLLSSFRMAATAYIAALRASLYCLRAQNCRDRAGNVPHPEEQGD